MNTRRTRSSNGTVATALLTLVALAACTGADSDAAPAAASEEGAAASVAASGDGSEGAPAGNGGGGGATATITLTLTGGDHDGTHEAEAPDAGCSRNLIGENTFGLQYSIAGTQGFTSLQMIIDDASAAASGSEDFRTDAIIDNANYGIVSGTAVTNEPRGSGTVTLDDRGDTATITIEGETGEGVGFNAEVECHTVSG